MIPSPCAEVAVISGGGSGHEPAMGGYVGPGLLTAAVCGGVFASPSVEAVLTALRTVTGPAGCLMIIMNYTGRLGLGLGLGLSRYASFMSKAKVVLALTWHYIRHL